MVKVALATSSDLPEWEVDDLPLHQALEARGADLVHPAWDDPEFDWGSCDACLIRTTWDYMERRRGFVSWAETVGARTRLFNPAAVVRWNTHKSYLRELESAGIPVVPTVWLVPGERVILRAVLDREGWDRAFLKPAVGATARETRRFTAAGGELGAAQEHLDRLLLEQGEIVLLQPYLERVETEGELSAVFLDGELSHGVRKIPVPGDYRVQDDFGASDEPARIPPGLGATARRALRVAERVTGADLLYGRADFLRDREGIHRLTELELVEPSLFFRHADHAPDRLARGLLRRIGSGPGPEGPATKGGDDKSGFVCREPGAR
ncbi:MAG: hypothetical protein R3234_07080 [Thermoanaerobaculia bacterium]|nr:hypothetical protein [Thermoanaerobaculia bacterium]